MKTPKDINDIYQWLGNIDRRLNSIDESMEDIYSILYGKTELNPDPLIGSREIKEMTGWSTSTFAKHCWRIPLKRLMGKLVIRKSEFNQWLEENLQS